MKQIFYIILFFSILCLNNKVIAQNDRYIFKLCENQDSVITYKQIKAIVSDNCDLIIIQDSAGRNYTIEGFEFILSPIVDHITIKDSTQSLFGEIVNGSKLTAKIINRLRFAKPGDLFVFHNVKITDKKKTVISKSYYFNIIE